MAPASVCPPISVPTGHLAFVLAGPPYSIAVVNFVNQSRIIRRGRKRRRK
jgi:hypothetical protein